MFIAIETIQLECETPFLLLKNGIPVYLSTSSHVITSVYFPGFFELVQVNKNLKNNLN